MDTADEIKASLVGKPHGWHITRFTMYRELAKAAATLDRAPAAALSIGKSNRLFTILNMKPGAVTEANYPAEQLPRLTFPDASFDMIVSDQVLEHVNADPQSTIDGCLRVLKPGGVVVHTTCFVYPFHKSPGDFWRMTDKALELLHAKQCQVITSGMWGNFDVWRYVAMGLQYVGVPLDSTHPLHQCAVNNDPQWPIVSWVVARKKQ